ncbi:DUF2382 domain-containing protein [Nakamurella endophytica]|uniref:Photosystem reaction center subunit H n=1 Tax=Nakamurella endophytica TaxID=1748367 RepID=A0A917WAX1_9ACTN|nr:PRC and DUF2382 domain-containing protein [Nakamurella endophytica]GGL88600.1 photosystem reaction center subunit H [Nakamurella endophytica]
MNPESDQAARLLDDGVVVGAGGDELGKVGQVFVDNETGQPTWVTVKTGWFGGNQSFVPLDDASIEGNRVVVPYDQDKVKGAPNFAEDEPLSEQDEDRLYEYYGVGTTSTAGYATGGTAATSGTAGYESTGTAGYESTGTAAATGYETTAGASGFTGAGQDVSGPNTDDAMTRSEEQLHVGTERVQTGRARLRKYIVTEQQSVTVPVTREEVRVEREPITEANREAALAGGDLTEEEHEVVLTEERPVVSKETVPVERVRLGTETVTDNQQVSADVRKEQIEFEDPTGTSGTTGTTTTDR